MWLMAQMKACDVPTKEYIILCLPGHANGHVGELHHKGSTRLASGNGAGTANDVNVTTKILAGNFFRHPAPQK